MTSRIYSTPVLWAIAVLLFGCAGKQTDSPIRIGAESVPSQARITTHRAPAWDYNDSSITILDREKFALVQAGLRQHSSMRQAFHTVILYSYRDRDSVGLLDIMRPPKPLLYDLYFVELDSTGRVRTFGDKGVSFGDWSSSHIYVFDTSGHTIAAVTQTTYHHTRCSPRISETHKRYFDLSFSIVAVDSIYTNYDNQPFVLSDCDLPDLKFLPSIASAAQLPKALIDCAQENLRTAPRLTSR